MDPYRLKVKIGDYEFEAEGPVADVQSQFAAFKEMVASIPITTKAPDPEPPAAGSSTPANALLPLERVIRLEDRVVSLTGRASSTSDAIMVILLGQKTFRNNEAVTGGEIIDGLKQSGIMVARIDYMLDKMASDEGLVIKIGMGRASRYRLTNQGASKAQEIAKAMIAEVA